MCQTNGVRRFYFQIGTNQNLGAEVRGSTVWLRSSWGLDGVCRFSTSQGRTTFVPVGVPFQMTWGAYRGARIGLFSYNNAVQAGWADFDWFHYEYSGKAAQP